MKTEERETRGITCCPQKPDVALFSWQLRKQRIKSDSSYWPRPHAFISVANHLSSQPILLASLWKHPLGNGSSFLTFHE